MTENNHKWLVSIGANLMMLMIALDLTIVNLALPAIAHTFNASMSTLQWIINAYILTFAMLLIVGGKLGDIFGHRRIFTIGIGIFTVASLIGGFASNSEILILSRILQGIGAAISFPTSSIINFAIFPKAQKSIAMGIMATIAGAGQALGPTVGGLILKYLTWSWVFFVNIPIGIIAIMIILLTCPKHILPLLQHKINYFAASLIAFGIFFLIYALNESQNWHIFSIKFISAIILSSAFLFAFFLNCKKSQHPLFDLDVFKNAKFVVANIARIGLAFCTMAIMFTCVLYMQNIAQFSPLMTGYLMLCMTACWAGFSPIVGILSGKFKNGSQIFLFAGVSLLIIAFLLLLQVSLSTSIIILIIAFIAAGCGVAAIFTASNTMALTSVQEHQLSSANSLLYLSALTSNMIGIAISGSMLVSSSSFYLLRQLVINNIQLPQNNLTLLLQISNGSNSLAKLNASFSTNFVTKLLPIATASFMHAFSAIMWFCLLLMMAVLLICVVFLKKEIKK